MQKKHTYVYITILLNIKCVEQASILFEGDTLQESFYPQICIKTSDFMINTGDLGPKTVDNKGKKNTFFGATDNQNCRYQDHE